MTSPIIQQFALLTRFLGDTLGPDYEVVLHDLSDRDHSIVAIANGHVSGRSVGAPLTTMALSDLKQGVYQRADFRANYSGLADNGKMLRSSTFFIKDAEGRMQGLLCINFDDSRYQELSERLLQLRHPDDFVVANFVYNADLGLLQEEAKESSETFHNSIAGVISETMNLALADKGVAPDRLTLEEKLAVITALDDKGVFLLKGAIREVAAALRCSQASVYRYLGRVHGNGNNNGND